ncbi:mitochondrial calcium uniporter regulator 1 isoform X2 [Latimeria chalumnae]|uniref:mitochondrial calcium uniporter regulator 1 isoform X2 n=1 Tax=Latimeria chalumnae TaxID=7897 RepID=UPI0003C123F6|nr:PREDICTED: mitochondrial calcium uniporter regulator 1 isoform X2 [Latimeria chalumnae]|eukprot:XP_005995263.1 PREDICTED: mitochondrial calcium uniporter regulator 1 isoform X2 [Latimeria chalumnae]
MVAVRSDRERIREEKGGSRRTGRGQEWINWRFSNVACVQALVEMKLRPGNCLKLVRSPLPDRGGQRPGGDGGGCCATAVSWSGAGPSRLVSSAGLKYPACGRGHCGGRDQPVRGIPGPFLAGGWKKPGLFGWGGRLLCGCKTVPGSTCSDSPLLRWTATVRDLSTSPAPLLYELRKIDISPLEFHKFVFDTHAVVRLLEENGFTTQQSEIIVASLVKIMNTNMELIYKDSVTKVQQEIMLQQIMSRIAAVKKDMIILEKSEFSTLCTENEKIRVELQQLKQQLMDEMKKVRINTKLDVNLEKSRVKEVYAEHERRLLETRTEIVELVRGKKKKTSSVFLHMHSRTVL